MRSFAHALGHGAGRGKVRAREHLRDVPAARSYGGFRRKLSRGGLLQGISATILYIVLRPSVCWLGPCRVTPPDVARDRLRG